MKILSWASIILLACTLLCGLWMKFAPGDNDVNFHTTLSVAAMVVCLITIILFMVRMR